MSYSIAQTYQGLRFVIDGEGTAENPLNFDTVYENVKSLMTGLYQVPQNYGAGTSANPYELCENNSSEWTSSGDVGTPADEAADYKYNSYSIKGTKTGSGDFQMLWNDNGTYNNWLTPTQHTFSLAAARVMKFSIKPSVTMNLDEIKVFGGGTTITYRFAHLNGGDGWELTSSVWNDFELELADFDHPQARFIGVRIFKIEFWFSGGSASDTVLIDGLHFVRDDCAAKKHTPYTYEFCFPLLFNDCYFKHDTEATILFIVGSGYYGSYYILEFSDCYQIELGSTADKYPLALIFDNVSNSDKNMMCEASECNVNIYNTFVYVTFCQWDKEFKEGVATSGSLSFYGNSPYTAKLVNCKLQGGNINVNERTELNNVDILSNGNFLYGAAGATTGPTINGIRVFNKPTVRGWIDTGTVRDVKFYDFADQGTQAIWYQRAFRLTYGQYLTFLNAESDGTDKTGLRITQYRYWSTEEQRTQDLVLNFGYTMNVKVKDKDDVLSGATVSLYDKDENLIFEEITDVNGDIEEQDVITLRNNLILEGGSSGSGGFSFHPWDKTKNGDWDNVYYPFTLVIEKAGYSTYRDENFQLLEPYEGEIALQELIPPLPETIIYGAELYGTTIY